MNKNSCSPDANGTRKASWPWNEKSWIWLYLESFSFTSYTEKNKEFLINHLNTIEKTTKDYSLPAENKNLNHARISSRGGHVLHIIVCESRQVQFQIQGKLCKEGISGIQIAGENETDRFTIEFCSISSIKWAIWAAIRKTENVQYRGIEMQIWERNR